MKITCSTCNYRYQEYIYNYRSSKRKECFGCGDDLNIYKYWEEQTDFCWKCNYYLSIYDNDFGYCDKLKNETNMNDLCFWFKGSLADPIIDFIEKL
jgi:hypothetical protein